MILHNTKEIGVLLLTSMCTTRSDMDFASLFSSIILSRPSALADPFMPFVDRFLELVEEDDEWLEPSIDPSTLGVGVVLTLDVFGLCCSAALSIVSFCGAFFAGAT